MDPYSSHHPYHITPPLLHHSQIPNPNPNPNLNLPIDLYKPRDSNYSGIGIDAGLRPPGIEPNPSLSFAYPYQAQQPSVAYAPPPAADVDAVSAPFSYFQDPNSAHPAQNWLTNEVISQYAAASLNLAIPPNGTEQLVFAQPHSALWSNVTVQPRKNGSWKKDPNKPKIAQSSWCEVCKIVCNSKEVLSHHILGKKHKKNLEKLIASAPGASSQSKLPAIGPQQNPDDAKGHKIKKEAEPATLEDLATKRRKVLESGAPENAVRTCIVCNVVCNSDTVFRFHLAGQKHALMMKKVAAGAGFPSLN